MPSYSQERKDAVLTKLLPPHNLAVSQIALSEGICEQTLYNWRKQAKIKGAPVPGNRPSTTDRWNGETKLAVVIETAGLNTQELGEYCRRKGLYPEQVKQWKQDCTRGANDAPRADAVSVGQLKEAKKKLSRLEKQLLRKDRALAESAALLVLQKKFQALWEDEDE